MLYRFAFLLFIVSAISLNGCGGPPADGDPFDAETDSTFRNALALNTQLQAIQANVAQALSGAGPECQPGNSGRGSVFVTGIDYLNEFAPGGNRPLLDYNHSSYAHTDTSFTRAFYGNQGNLHRFREVVSLDTLKHNYHTDALVRNLSEMYTKLQATGYLAVVIPDTLRLPNVENRVYTPGRFTGKLVFVNLADNKVVCVRPFRITQVGTIEYEEEVDEAGNTVGNSYHNAIGAARNNLIENFFKAVKAYTAQLSGTDRQTVKINER